MKARLLNYLTTFVLIGLAAWAAWTLYQRYVETPWTRDCQVRANVVGIAPRVSGPIIRIAVQDNQQIKQGELLFEIDPQDFKAEVDVANGQLQTSEANLKQSRQDMARQTDLYNKRVSSQQDYQNAQDKLDAAEAAVVSAKANLELANLKLSYTKVFATVDGFVTNMNVSVGAYVNAGSQLMALVDANSYWIAAYFKETLLSRIHKDQKARITILGHEQQPFQGTVDSVGWGIFVQDGSATNTTDLLPSVSQTVDWIRLPQRFPVRIHVDGTQPVPLRIGQTVSVSMEPLEASAKPLSQAP
jgi:multidrug resistance efflux pump